VGVYLALLLRQSLKVKIANHPHAIDTSGIVNLCRSNDRHNNPKNLPRIIFIFEELSDSNLRYEYEVIILLRAPNCPVMTKSSYKFERRTAGIAVFKTELIRQKRAVYRRSGLNEFSPPRANCGQTS